MFENKTTFFGEEIIKRILSILPSALMQEDLFCDIYFAISRGLRILNFNGIQNTNICITVSRKHSYLKVILEVLELNLLL